MLGPTDNHQLSLLHSGLKDFSHKAYWYRLSVLFWILGKIASYVLGSFRAFEDDWSVLLTAPVASSMIYTVVLGRVWWTAKSDKHFKLRWLILRISETVSFVTMFVFSVLPFEDTARRYRIIYWTMLATSILSLAWLHVS